MNYSYGIKITTENFEQLYVDSAYIDSVEVNRDSIQIVFNREFSYKNKNVIDRIRVKHDITYIDFYHTDMVYTEVEVPYLDDDEGNNQYQNIFTYDDGKILLDITKRKGLIQ